MPEFLLVNSAARDFQLLETNDEMMRWAHMTFPVLRNINLLTKKSFDNALTMAIEKQFVQETVSFLFLFNVANSREND